MGPEQKGLSEKELPFVDSFSRDRTWKELGARESKKGAGSLRSAASYFRVSSDSSELCKKALGNRRDEKSDTRVRLEEKNKKRSNFSLESEKAFFRNIPYPTMAYPRFVPPPHVGGPQRKTTSPHENHSID